MSRDRSPFTACTEALPAALRERVQRLRDHALARRTCPSCQRIADLLWWTFDAAFVNDHAAAARAVDEAEQLLVADHPTGCILRSARARRPGRRVPGFDRPGPLVAATDASHVGTRSGMGYVTSDGRWGTQHRNGNGTRYLPDPTGPHRVLVAELRAVGLLLDDLGADANRLELLLVDSTSAIDYLRGWQAGHVTRMPPGYSLRPRFHRGEPAMVVLAGQMRALPAVRVRHVKGHSRHPLNEAADSLAKLGRRRPPDVTVRAEAVVSAFLTVWHTPSPIAAKANGCGA